MTQSPPPPANMKGTIVTTDMETTGRGEAAGGVVPPAVTTDDQRAKLPDVGQAKRCKLRDCPAPNFETGFGLAGGGYGIYEYCPACGCIVSKTQARDDE